MDPACLLMDKKEIVWVVALLCALQGACGGPSAAPSPSPPPTPVPAVPTRVVLRIEIVESTTGTPVPGAFVVVRRTGETTQFSQSAGNDGVVQFDDCAPGAIVISATRAGYELSERELTLTADTTVRFGLVPRRYLLSGRVIDVESRQPLAGATLQVLDGDNVGRTAATEADGTYRLPDLLFGGFTLRVRRSGYDSMFAGMRLTGPSTLDFEMRRAQQSLAGTWTGSAQLTTGSRFDFAEVTLTHSGNIVANAPGQFAYSFLAFTGTLDDVSRIGSTTGVSGALRWTTQRGNPRTPTTCTGTGAFTGTVNWTTLRITAPRVIYDCEAEPAVGVTLSLIRQQ